MPTEVILVSDVPKLGQSGEVVRVKSGYARNYLLPQGLAMLATRGRRKELEHKQRMIEARERKEVSGHQQRAKALGELELEFARKAGEEGKLFGSVTSAEIAASVAGRGIVIDRRKIELPEPIKELGEHQVQISLHREVKAQLKVKVVAEE